MKTIDDSQRDQSRADRQAHYLLRAVNKANFHFGLLMNGDRVLVSVSGGKDSMTMLDLLYRYRRLAPQRYSLVAAHVVSDWHCGQMVPREWLRRWCHERCIELLMPTIDVADEIAGGESSPCFRCAWQRRKALFDLAAQYGCAKVAFGHHADDIAETTLLNLFYSGRIDRMGPKMRLFDGALTVIRPLAFVEERDIVSFARASGFPIAGEPCPEGLTSRRATVKRVLREIERESRGVKRSIFRAVELHQRALPQSVEWGAGVSPASLCGELEARAPGKESEAIATDGKA